MPRAARLEILQGGPLHVVEVPPGGLEIGRGEVTLSIDAASLSKRHAFIGWDADDLVVEDLGSTNQVHRDGRRLEGRAILADGDELVLGEVVLRVSVTGHATTLSVDTLPDTTNVMSPRGQESGPTSLPNEVERRAAEILPIVEQFFHARDLRDLARKVASAARAALRTSRAALLEIEDGGRRLRVLAVEGAKDHAFVSRTVVNEAMRRGIALHQLGAVGRQVSGSLVDARAASALAAMVRTTGERVRVLYVDVLAEHLGGQSPVLTWRHAFELQMFAASAASAFEALEAQRREAQERLRFEGLRRNFSPSLVEQLSLLHRPEQEVLAPVVMPATVVFADLSGITRLTERWRARPQALVSLLDLWFEMASRAVFAQNGTLDKFIGDGVMAVFGAPFPLEGASIRALHAVLDMQRAVARLSRDTGEALALTASVCSGPVLSCTTGSRRRHEYTVLGETVGRAARLREQAIAHEILLDEAVAGEVSSQAELEFAGQTPATPHSSSLGIWRFRAAKR